MSQFTRVISSPIGELFLSASASGLCRIEIVSDEEAGRRKRILVMSKSPSMIVQIHLDESENWLNAFFSDPHNLPKQPDFDFGNAGDFFRRVWGFLASSEVGQTLTYGELARAVDNPGASRAVGTAMTTNPIPIIVPCHRVLPKSQEIGRYSGLGGIETKRWLLTHEASSL
jgi:O-6-methylguanine DNA methyltransferase